MAQVVVRTNLSSKSFPFLSESSGRGIFVKQYDQNYEPSITSKEDEDKDLGIPSLYYCHNVMPTSQGYQAVGYYNKIAKGELSSEEFIEQEITVVYQDTGYFGHVGISNEGKFYAADAVFTGAWRFLGITVAGYISGTSKLTGAVVNGRSFIWVSNLGGWETSWSVGQLGLTTIAPAGLVATTVGGILSVQGYLVAWTNYGVVWSALTDPLDFVPSLTTGAGGGSVQGVKTAITACISHAAGFVIYTASNIIIAAYSGNSRYPFNFREIPSSAGLANLDLVAHDPSTGNHIAYTAGGVQTISIQSTQAIFPELTDFLSGAVFEDFDESTNVFSTVTQDISSATFTKKLHTVADRYLVFSYAQSTTQIQIGGVWYKYMTHLIVYDSALKRWGKLKINHFRVMDIAKGYPEDYRNPKNTFGIVKLDGSVDVINFNTRNGTNAGVALLGKYQYIRQRLFQLDSVDVENTPAGITVTDLYTLDGKNFLQQTGYLQANAGLASRFLFSRVGINHSLLFKGNFNLTSIVLAGHVHGRV